ncbi:MAG: regulatory protein RecX [Chloroflexi bacterium]|nr:regulatory protein RecX [Chloroflexota bacterium]
MRNAARTRRRGSVAPPSDDPRKAVQHGLRLLSRSARSEHDLRERLEARFTAEAVTAALRRLRALGYVDDRAWAAAYVERPRSLLCSARLLQRELRSRGISHEIAEAATGEHDDDRAALAAARIALRRLSRRPGGSDAGSDRTRSRRLVAALARRGFDPGTIERVRSRLRGDRAREANRVTP